MCVVPIPATYTSPRIVVISVPDDKRVLLVYSVIPSDGGHAGFVQYRKQALPGRHLFCQHHNRSIDCSHTRPIYRVLGGDLTSAPDSSDESELSWDVDSEEDSLNGDAVPSSVTSCRIPVPGWARNESDIRCEYPSVSIYIIICCAYIRPHFYMLSILTISLYAQCCDSGSWYCSWSCAAARSITSYPLESYGMLTADSHIFFVFMSMWVNRYSGEHVILCCVYVSS